MNRILVVVLFWTSLATAQVVGPGFVNYVTSAPSGSCSQNNQQQNVLGSGQVWTCQNGTWAQVGAGGGSGTVTNVTGTPNQIDVATGTTTPVLSLDAAVTFPGTITAIPCGVANTTSCVITGQGGTSGTATITWPAVAGTSTNAFVLSNVLSAPLGTAGATSYAFTGHLGYGMFWDATSNAAATSFNGNEIAVFGNATLGMGTGTVLKWYNNNLPAGSADTGLSRDSAAVVDIGNGTAGDKSGTVNASTFNSTSGPLSGTWQCANVTPVTVNANVTTDQLLMACTIPAGILNRVGRSLRIQVAGVYSTAAASVAAISFKAKLCTVSGCGSGTVISPLATTTGATSALSASNLAFQLNGNSTTQTAGASSAYEAHGSLVIDLSSTTTVSDSIYADTNAATVGTIDSTAQLFLQITGSFSAASTSNSITERQLVVDTVN